MEQLKALGIESAHLWYATQPLQQLQCWLGKKIHMQVISQDKSISLWSWNYVTSFFIIIFHSFKEASLCSRLQWSHLCKNCGSKKCGIRNFLARKKLLGLLGFLVLFCSFIFPLSKQLFYWSTTGSSSKLLSGKSISIMIIPICFVKRNSCLYSICFNNVHLNIHYIFRVDTGTARVFMSCK